MFTREIPIAEQLERAMRLRWIARRVGNTSDVERLTKLIDRLDAQRFDGIGVN